MDRGRRRKYTFGLFGVVILMWGAVWSVAQNQTTPASTFTLQQVIGKPQPRDIRYNPQYDRFAWINSTGQLALANAATYEEIAVLTPDDPGTLLNDYRFSPDGRWLAVARDKQIDLWDVSSAQLVGNFQTDSTLGLEGPLWFSDDGRQLVFQSRVPAPQSTRRSENDTVLVAWVWDTVAARDAGRSELPNGVIALPMYDYRNGFILGKGKKVVAGLPSRLRTVEVTTQEIRIISETEDPQRIEVDPIDAWESEADGWMTLRTQTGNLVQVDPNTGLFLPILAGRNLQLITTQTVNAFHQSPATQPLGPLGDITLNPLRARLLGEDYRTGFNFAPVTMYLIDVLQPITPTAAVPGLLVYTRNDVTGEGWIEFLNVPNSRAVRLHPNGRQLLIQNAEGNQQITVYDIATGTVQQIYYPTQMDADVVDYNASGSALVVGLERYDTATQTSTFFDAQHFVNTSQIFFTQDGKSLITLDSGTYQQWDVETGTLMRQEYFYARGEIVRTAPDGTRMLTRLDLPTGQTLYEVIDIAGGTRPTLTIALPVNTTLLGVYPDDTWEQFFVLVGDNNSTRPESRIQAALFRMGSDAPLWLIGNGDLPSEIADIRWLNAETLAFQYSSQVLPAPRIENIQYAASGLPTCLVDGLPDAGMRWLGLWDQFNQTMSPTSLDTLAAHLCQIVRDNQTPRAAAAAIEAYLLSPTPTPTEVFGTPRPAHIPGIPECITQRFTREALQYAQDWRTITEGLTPAQIADLAVLVCQGLTGDASPMIGFSGQGGMATQYLTIDVNTLVRTIHNGTLPPAPARPDLGLVAEAWRREKRFEIGNFALSPDGQQVAVGDGPFISIYSIDPSYAGLAATATATFMPQGTAEKYLSVRPSPTPPAKMIQATLMPTFTPTWTPTPMPLPAGTAIPANQVEATCPLERLPLAALPLAERPEGVLYGALWNDQNTRYPWQFELTTSKSRLRDDIPACDFTLNCSASPNNRWILYMDKGSTWVSRWDGEQAVELFTPLDAASQPTSITWVGTQTLEWRFQEYRPDLSPNPITFIQRYDPETQTYSEPVQEDNSIPQVNNLPTEFVTRQPQHERYELLAVNVREGRRYYWHDRQTNQISLFLITTGESMSYEWQPNGERFYYQVSSRNTYYVYDFVTGRNGPTAYYTGMWSPDANKTVQTYVPTARELYDYERENRQLPRLTVWNRENNTMTRYCLPDTDINQGANILMWSPDSRYLLVQAALKLPETYEVSRPQMLILDTETGRVIDLGADIERVTIWTTLSAGASS